MDRITRDRLKPESKWKWDALYSARYIGSLNYELKQLLNPTKEIDKCEVLEIISLQKAALEEIEIKILLENSRKF